MKMRVRPALFTAAALALGGCFHPLYGPGDGGKNIATEMRAIAVDPIPTRTGHYLGNDLIFALHGGNEDVPTRYHLIVTTSEYVTTALVDSVQGRATAGTLYVTASYRLVPADNPAATLTSGSVTSLATYDRSEQRFANIRAGADAQIRDTKTIADQLRTRLAIYFTTRP